MSESVASGVRQPAARRETLDKPPPDTTFGLEVPMRKGPAMSLRLPAAIKAEVKELFAAANSDQELTDAYAYALRNAVEADGVELPRQVEASSNGEVIFEHAGRRHTLAASHARQYLKLIDCAEIERALDLFERRPPAASSAKVFSDEYVTPTVSGADKGRVPAGTEAAAAATTASGDLDYRFLFQVNGAGREERIQMDGQAVTAWVQANTTPGGPETRREFASFKDDGEVIVLGHGGLRRTIAPINYTWADEVFDKIEATGNPELIDLAEKMYGHAFDQRRMLRERVGQEVPQQLLIDDKDVSLSGASAGDPGTGKTSGEKLLGELSCALGLTPKGMVELALSKLEAEPEAIQRQLDGLVGCYVTLDEAGQLTEPHGQEHIGWFKAWIKWSEDHRGQAVFRFLMYERQLEDFLSLDDGAGRRTPTGTIRYPKPPVEDVAAKLVEYLQDIHGYRVNEAASEALIGYLRRRNGHPTYGNYGEIGTVAGEARLNVGRRNRQLERLGVRATAEVGPEELLGSWLRAQESTEARDALSSLGQKDVVRWLSAAEDLAAETGDSDNPPRLPKVLFVEAPKGTPGEEVAKTLLPAAMAEMGLVIDKSTLFISDFASLGGNAVGDAATNVGNTVKNARGRILVIKDPFAGLTNNGFGPQAVNALGRSVENEPVQAVFVGTPEELAAFASTSAALPLVELANDDRELAYIRLEAISPQQATERLCDKLAAAGIDVAADQAPRIEAVWSRFHSERPNDWRNHEMVDAAVVRLKRRLSSKREDERIDASQLADALHAYLQDRASGTEPEIEARRDAMARPWLERDDEQVSWAIKEVDQFLGAKSPAETEKFLHLLEHVRDQGWEDAMDVLIYMAATDTKRPMVRMLSERNQSEPHVLRPLLKTTATLNATYEPLSRFTELASEELQLLLNAASESPLALKSLWQACAANQGIPFN
jgi:hypothetical protein